MAPCKFWAQGNCRNGNNCRFEHGPINGGSQQSNRFAPLQNQGQQTSRHRHGTQTRELPFSLDKEAIIVDLTSERPQWILSAYGPGRFAPAQLFGGPQREQSFEEMRLSHYVGAAAGNLEGAVQAANQMYHTAEQQMQNAAKNIDGAIEYILNAQNEHPNRVDIVAQSRGGGSESTTFAKSNSLQGGSSNPRQNPFGAPSQASSSFQAASTTTAQNPFGAPSQPVPNPFGRPSQSSAFGAPSQSTPGSSFGAPSQPSAFGASSSTQGAFGQPSALGQKPNPFGAPSAPAFGGPSQLGRSAGAFGQPSVLGQKPNPFDASSTTTSGTSGGFSSFSGPSAFGAPSQSTSSGPFGGQNQPGAPFGAPSQPSSQANPFGQPSPAPFGAPSPASNNPFGGNPAAPSTPNPFGQPSAPSHPSPFGGAPTTSQTTPFGAAPVAQNNPFGGATSTPLSNPFGAPSNIQNSIKTPFGQNSGVVGSSLSSGNVNGQVGGYQPQGSGAHDVSTYSSRDGSGKLVMFKGKRVEYKDNEPGYIGYDGQWCRIFFPDGPPPNPIKTTTDPNDQYDAATESAYKQLLETGSFPEDTVPLLPPKKEWVRWDF